MKTLYIRIANPAVIFFCLDSVGMIGSIPALVIRLAARQRRRWNQQIYSYEYLLYTYGLILVLICTNITFISIYQYIYRRDAIPSANKNINGYLWRLQQFSFPALDGSTETVTCHQQPIRLMHLPHLSLKDELQSEGLESFQGQHAVSCCRLGNKILSKQPQYRSSALPGHNQKVFGCSLQLLLKPF